MIDKKLGDLDDEIFVGNSRLEKLLKHEITPQILKEVFELLKDSRLFLPVIFRKNRYEDVKKEAFELNGQFGFDIEDLPYYGENDAVPLFTNLEIINTYFPKFSSAIAISMKDLAGMLKQTDQYTSILINPFGCRFKIPMDIFLSQFGFISNHKIKDVKNEELNQLLCKKDFSDDELKEKLLASTVIVPCIDEPEGTSFVLIFDDDKEYFQVYTDLDEYKKGLEHDLSEIYPPAYSFSALLKFAKEYFVMNRSSDSVVFRAEIFR